MIHKYISNNHIPLLFISCYLILSIKTYSNEPNHELGKNIFCPTKLFIDACDSKPLDSFEIERSDITGYLGSKFTRFSIFFDSSDTPADDSGVLYGKTRKQNDVCRFRADLKIESRHVEPYKFGKTSGSNIELIYSLSGIEDSCANPGKIAGTISIFVFKFRNGKTVYSSSAGLGLCEDGISNLQFKGNWFPNNGKMKQKLRWGSGRIPDSEGLDCGTAEFSPCQSINNPEWIQFNKEYDCQTESKSHKSAKCINILKSSKWWLRK